MLIEIDELDYLSGSMVQKLCIFHKLFALVKFIVSFFLDYDEIKCYNEGTEVI